MLAFTLTLLVLALAILAAFALTSRKNQDKRPGTQPRAADTFVIAPYVQLGDRPHAPAKESLEVIWFTSSNDHLWALEFALQATAPWTGATLPTEDSIKTEGIEPLTRWRVLLTGLIPGAKYRYRVLRDGVPVFQATLQAPRPPGEAFTFVAVGDLANGWTGASKIAYRIDQSRPDLLVLAGDVVYKRGRVSEYLERFFPIYNRQVPEPQGGGQVLRSTPTVAAFGNHDAGIPYDWEIRDLDRYPDLLGFFYFWSQPLNGPTISPGSRNTPDLKGAPSRQQAFLAAAGKTFPRMANYSFDYGDSHWLVLDANEYMDWTSPELRAWVENDLASTRATWKFVVFHQPSFSTDIKHRDEQRMRLLSDIFQRQRVDVVFSGHNHAYERNFPLTFHLKPQRDGRLISPEGRVDGDFQFDRDFDGNSVTKPRGVIYLVTGGGGAKLYLEPERRANPESLPPYTHKLIDDIHSFTFCEVKGGTLTIRQISEDGLELDRIVVTKEEART